MCEVMLIHPKYGCVPGIMLTTPQTTPVFSVGSLLLKLLVDFEYGCHFKGNFQKVVLASVTVTPLLIKGFENFIEFSFPVLFQPLYFRIKKMVAVVLNQKENYPTWLMF